MSRINTVGSHKTAVFHDEGWQKVVYHSTCVAKWNHGEIVLDSGGYQTNTTKTRLNQASNQYGLGYQVYQKNWNWYIDYKGKTIDFEDGIVLER